ncbi:peptidase domain-containing ABC transporter [Streptomyces sp. NPDC046870]|uniref:peptidase domain-containing ABC transporter n=1 Tax=Streptomyces sp. NPDC046870 TaxID=3155135 RepID=UPI003456B2B0
MTNTARFRSEAVEHRHGHRGLGPALGHDLTPRPRRSLLALGRSLLGRLREGRRPRVPVCFQTQVSDCGPACLVMTLRHHGVEAELEAVRARADSGRNGASARTLLEIAREFGLKGRGVRTDLAGLRHLPAGSILFWNFSHFVVLEAATADHVDIVDPAHGRRRLAWATVGEAFTGVALEFEPPLERAARARRPGTTGPWARLRHLRPGPGELRGIAAASLALMAFEFVLPLTISRLVGHVLPGRLHSELWLITVGLGTLVVLFLALQLTRSLLLIKRQALVEKQLTWGVMEHLASLPYDYFTVHNAGDLAMRVRTSSTLNQVLSVTAVSAVFDSVLIVVYLAAIVLANPVLAALVIGLIAVQAGLTAVTWRRQTALNHEVLEQQTRAQNELVEMLESITTLKAAGVEGEAVERWSHALVREVNKRLRARRSLAAFTAVGRTVQFGAPVVVLLAGTWRVLDGHDSLGSTLAFMALTTALFAPLEGMFAAVSQLASVRPTLARLDDVLQAEPEPRAAGTPAPAPAGEAAAITAEGVSFRYRGAPSPALSGVELDIRPGQFVAVVGRSGSGKSTLGMLLAGLYLPTSGTITVDGTDLADLDRPGYRRQIGYVNQNAHLFSGTIRENIAFGAGEPDQADLIRAVKAACVHEEIAALPMGYDTLVGPGGHGLSGGQRQRIILARALARRPRLLVLDEATSALDPQLEEEIFDNLLNAGITAVVIAHRLTVLERADHVVVVRDGKVVEAGSPAELKAAGGEFLCLT